jgi:hypothetical protein
MNMKGKIDLYAKIRHEYRWGVGTIRGLAEMFKVHRRLVRDALDNPLPPKRKIPLRQHTSLASAIPLIDVLLLADRDVPYSQKHSAPSIHHQIQSELAGLRVAGSRSPLLLVSGHAWPTETYQEWQALVSQRNSC